MSADASSTTKKFGKGERTVLHHTQKASRFYPAYDEPQPKKVSVLFVRPWQKAHQVPAADVSMGG